jgi:hypothetical protein
MTRPGVIPVALLATAVVAAFAAPAGGGPLVPGVPVETSATNPFAGCPADGSGTNFADSEVEPWIDINPTDPDNIVGTYQQDRYSNGGAKSNAAAVSVDGGTTWTQVAIPNLTRCSPGGGPYERATDPWLSFGPDGTLHHMSLVLDPDPPGGGFGDNAMVYNRSTDGGLTWDPAVVLQADDDPRLLNDKNSMTADPNDADVVYAVWDRLRTASGEIASSERGRENIFGLGFKGPILFTRTTDGGDTWEPARELYDPAANNQTIGSQIVVQPDGTVINFFNEILNFRNSNHGPQFDFTLALLRSDDQGASFGGIIRAQKMFPMDRFREDGVIDTEPVTCPDPTDQGACPIRTGDILFDVAVDRSNGTLYAVWQDARFGGVTHDDIALSRSTDGGTSWSSPIKVNRTPATEPVNDQQAFTPSVHVTDDGTVVVTHYDFRNNTATDNILGTDYWAVHCHASTEDCTNAASWDEETRITPTSFDMRQAPFARGYFVGDYEGLTSDGTDVLAYFSASHAGDPSSAFFSRLTP